MSGIVGSDVTEKADRYKSIKDFSMSKSINFILNEMENKGF